MARPFQSLLLFLAGSLLFFAGCGRGERKVDISGMEAEVSIERFDQDLFAMKQDSMEWSIGRMYESYGDFFDVFNVHIINIGLASTRSYPSYLSMFINDPTNREVFEYTSDVFDDMSDINLRLSEAFRQYLYHYPDSSLPRVIGYVSRFNQGLLTVGSFIGVGLDQYLGSDCAYYTMMGTPQYLVRNKLPERIPLDVMMAWATRLYPYNDSVDNVLNRQIYKGMLRWFSGLMMPGTRDEELMGFSPDQMKWCLSNEKQMWTYLVEHKLLFDTDPLTIRKLSEDAPYTQYFTSESPGRAVNWLGLQIVRDFVKRNSGITVPELMAIRDYQEILRRSKYNP